MSEKIVKLNEEVMEGQIKEALIEMYLADVSVRCVEDVGPHKTNHVKTFSGHI